MPPNPIGLGAAVYFVLFMDQTIAQESRKNGYQHLVPTYLFTIQRQQITNFTASSHLSLMHSNYTACTRYIGTILLMHHISLWLITVPLTFIPDFYLMRIGDTQRLVERTK